MDKRAADLTIVSESVGSASVNIEVKDSITPVITAEGFLFDDMGYGINPAEATSETDISIIDPNHPLAAGLPAGDVAIYDQPGFMSWAEIGGDVTIVATMPSDPAELAAISVYEKGAILDDGTVTPAMRIGLPHSGITQAPFPVWTPQGEALFAAAIDYALGLTSDRAQLQAGDADQDLDFDQLDLVQVQIAAKYLTQSAATWGEGDWNGAPGGSPGDPPAGDRVFNQLDIIAALVLDEIGSVPPLARNVCRRFVEEGLQSKIDSPLKHVIGKVLGCPERGLSKCDRRWGFSRRVPTSTSQGIPLPEHHVDR